MGAPGRRSGTPGESQSDTRGENDTRPASRAEERTPSYALPADGVRPCDREWPESRTVRNRTDSRVFRPGLRGVNPEGEAPRSSRVYHPWSPGRGYPLTRLFLPGYAAPFHIHPASEVEDPEALFCTSS